MSSHDYGQSELPRPTPAGAPQPQYQRPHWQGVAAPPPGAAAQSTYPGQQVVRKGAPWWLFILGLTVLPFGACVTGVAIGSAGNGAEQVAADSGAADRAAPASADSATQGADAAATSQPPTAADESVADEPPAEQAPAAPGIGASVTDGEFTFVVTGVERPGTTIGEEPFAETAQGEFVIVRVDVSNTGDEARSFSSSNQYLYDDQGRKFETTSAIFALPDADKAFLEDINPGNSVTGAPLVFDVPAGAVLDRIELHDVFYSEGVAVNLR